MIQEFPGFSLLVLQLDHWARLEKLLEIQVG